MRFTMRSFQALTMALAVMAAPSGGGMTARAAEPAASLEGTWKLVVLAFGEDEFAIIKVEQRDGKSAASVVSAQNMVVGKADDLKIDPIAIDGNSLWFDLKTPDSSHRFQGNPAESGPATGQILGAFNFRGDNHPARLQRTESTKVADLQPGPMFQEYVSAAREKDAHVKGEKPRESIRKHAGNPTSYLFYTELLNSAAAAKG
ncbi:MAG: hypothetical protein ACP5XB_30475 [Isosphaeraceae bacterium]